jgi:hypothetical protein
MYNIQKKIETPGFAVIYRDSATWFFRQSITPRHENIFEFCFWFAEIFACKVGSRTMPQSLGSKAWLQSLFNWSSAMPFWFRAMLHSAGYTYIQILNKKVSLCQHSAEPYKFVYFSMNSQQNTRKYFRAWIRDLDEIVLRKKPKGRKSRHTVSLIGHEFVALRSDSCIANFYFLYVLSSTNFAIFSLITSCCWSAIIVILF